MIRLGGIHAGSQSGGESSEMSGPHDGRGGGMDERGMDDGGAESGAESISSSSSSWGRRAANSLGGNCGAGAGRGAEADGRGGSGGRGRGRGTRGGSPGVSSRSASS